MVFRVQLRNVGERTLDPGAVAMGSSLAWKLSHRVTESVISVSNLGVQLLGLYACSHSSPHPTGSGPLAEDQ